MKNDLTITIFQRKAYIKCKSISKSTKQEGYMFLSLGNESLDNWYNKRYQNFIQLKTHPFSAPLNKIRYI